MHHHHHSPDHATEVQETTVIRGDVRGTRAFILGGLSSGHSIFHWYIQSFWVVLPRLSADLGLSPLQVGSLITVREFVSGLVNIPGGFLTDLLRRHWGLLMATCVAGLGLGYLLVGFSPNYAALLVALGVVAVPPAIWHLPAMAALSRRFAHHRGFALGAHNVGGSVGDVVGPVLTGFLLVVLTWRQVFSLYALPVLLLAVVVWWAFKPLGAGQRGPRPTAGEQLHVVGRLVRNPVLLGLMSVGGFRAMGHIAFLTFLPLYLADELLMSSPRMGFHIGLLTFLGVFSAPVLGMLSDRLGRKMVLVPGFLVEGLLVFGLLAVSGVGPMLTLVIALLGLFIFSTQPVIIAGAMDIIGEGAEATTLSFLFTTRFVFAAVSPLIAGGIYGAMGIEPAFLYVGSLFILAGLVVVMLPLRRPVAAARQHHH